MSYISELKLEVDFRSSVMLLRQTRGSGRSGRSGDGRALDKAEVRRIRVAVNPLPYILF